MENTMLHCTLPLAQHVVLATGVMSLVCCTAVTTASLLPNLQLCDKAPMVTYKA
jgi:hypothetical protein